ncbi:RHS repeat-associated core domain-containing protein [Dactylosporangium sp. NPDC050688]|uniref:RHS repeat domain-containing protein n=1 Tax=Dactylosporangium sp. NPDC050688 TaxID=3157217 RepID=UPI00340A31F7
MADVPAAPTSGGQRWWAVWFARLRRRPRPRAHRSVAVSAVALAVAVSAGGVLVASSGPDRGERPQPQQDRAVAVAAAAPAGAPAGVTGRPFQPRAVSWPAAAAGEVALQPAAAPGPARTVRVSGTPVSVGPAAGAAAPARVRVRVLDRAATQQAGVAGVLLAVARADGAATAGTARVSVDYGEFRDAYGGDWATRLRLVLLPGCAATAAPGCAPVALASTNDPRTGTVSADVPLSAADTATETLVALAAGAAGSAGDVSATPLSQAATWSAGGNSGGFSWGYPLRTPPGVDGPEPELSLMYSSSSVDGLTAASNNQPSWIGEGFSLPVNAVERRYVPCGKDMSGGNNATKTGDLCWKRDNAVVTLNGVSTELLKDSAGTWHARTEEGWRIEQRTGGVNGDNNGEHWVVTTMDGTQYWFGRNRLPGWASGKAETASVYTVPVFGNHAGEPCHASTFTSSGCDQAWKWNLDYVVDTFGNTQSLWYVKESNSYARAGSTTTLAGYVRGGRLARIDYGTRSDTAYGNAPARVVFNPADRCLSSCYTNAKPNRPQWPDTPWDQECTATPCLVGGPSFWETKRLASVQTQVWGGSAYRPVETWTLTHSFPDPGDGTRAGLFLDRISHTGSVGTTTTVPDVTFGGVQLANRVDSIDGSAPMNWWRLATVTTESGGVIGVTYKPQECVAGSRMPSAPESNTLRCFPVRWTPEGATSPKTEYFHKYVVDTVTETDMALPSNARSVRSITAFQYLDSPAWRYTDDDGLVDDASKTWSVWRGYGRVRVTTGDPGEQQRTETVYFRGMHGDHLPGGTRSVTMPAAGGAAAVADEDEYAGMARESIVYLGATSTEVSATVTEPWRSDPTATRSLDGVTVHARYIGEAATRARTALDGGRGNRTTVTRSTFDAYGLATQVENLGDDAVTGDEECAITTFVRNTANWLMELPSREQRFATTCARARGTGLTDADILADTYTSYDQQARGAAPTKGAVSRIEQLVAYTPAPVYRVTGRSTHDIHGRAVETWDARGNRSTVTYTPATGGPVTRIVNTDQDGWQTTTTVEPAWGSLLTSTDVNGKTTEVAYDGLGRKTEVWLPNRSRAAGQSGNGRFTYTMRRDAASVVATARLNAAGSYVTTYELYDGMLRLRQTQVPEGGTQGGRIVTDTTYDSAERPVKQTKGYVADGAPSATLVMPLSDALIPAWNKTVYDGAGRTAAVITYAKDVELWRSSMVYGGDRTDITPPAGGPPTSTWTDADGHTTKVRQYAGAVGSATYTETSYGYNTKGLRDRVTDSAGNVWVTTYNLLAKPLTIDDPDKGLTRMAYTTYGDVETATDSRGEVLAYTYDARGRKTSVRDDTVTGAKRMEWTYDTAARGLLATATRYDNGNAYTTTVTGYNDLSQPTGKSITIPAAETGLAGTYTYVSTYNVDGSPATTRLPAAGGLPTETLKTAYSATGQPSTMKTDLSATGDDVFLVNGTSYTRYGELATIGRRYDTGASLDTTMYYQEGTRRLQRVLTTRITAPTVVSDLNYSYDRAGNILGIADTPAGGAADTQCFGYDYLRRLTEAWTPGGGDCAATRSQSALGGPAPYWHSYTYDTIGNRRTSTERTATTSRSRTYTYPAAGADGPHTLSSVATGGGGTVSYGYDPSGNTVNRPAPAGGTQQLTWTAEGNLATVTDGSGQTSYLYDADGSRLISRAPGKKTLYLPNQELSYATGTATKTASRYYAHAGQIIGMRDKTGLTWMFGDHQGTTTAAVTEAGQAVTRRRTTPFGEDRGPAVAWPDDKGLVGGVRDGTGMTHIGAREYDAGIGRFISVDPIMDADDSQQMHGYTYSNSSPVTFSDPDGKIIIGDDQGLLVERKHSWGFEIIDRRRPSGGHRFFAPQFPTCRGCTAVGGPAKPWRPKVQRFYYPVKKPAPRTCTSYTGGYPVACSTAWKQYWKIAGPTLNAIRQCEQSNASRRGPCNRDLVREVRVNGEYTFLPKNPLPSRPEYDEFGMPYGEGKSEERKGGGRVFLTVSMCSGFLCVGFNFTTDGPQVTTGTGGRFGISAGVGYTSAPARDQAAMSVGGCTVIVVGPCLQGGRKKQEAGGGWWGGGSVNIGFEIGPSLPINPQWSKDLD